MKDKLHILLKENNIVEKFSFKSLGKDYLCLQEYPDELLRDAEKYKYVDGEIIIRPDLEEYELELADKLKNEANSLLG